MRKSFSLVLVVMMVLGIATMCFAEGMYNREPGYTVKILSVAPAGPGSSAHQLDTTIVAGNRILGFEYTDTATGTIGLWDAAAVASIASTNRIGEVSVAAGTSETVMFPFPKKLDNGLVYSATTATGDLMVFYE